MLSFLEFCGCTPAAAPYHAFAAAFYFPIAPEAKSRPRMPRGWRTLQGEAREEALLEYRIRILGWANRLFKSQVYLQFPQAWEAWLKHLKEQLQ